MMRLPTASSLDRACACPASCVLPQTRTTSGDATDGTALHAYVEQSLTGAPVAALPPHLVERAAAIPLDRLAGFESEVALRYHVPTGRAERLATTGRAYAFDPGWIYGTADLVGRDADGAVVWDLKSGDAPRASDSMQLALLGLAAATVIGADSARVAMVVLRPSGAYWIDEHTLDAIDLAAVAARLAGMVERIEAASAVLARGDVPPTNAGDWCRYCPALRYCPAQAAMVRTATGWDVATMAERIAALSDDDAGRAWATISAVERIAEAGKKALQERARQSPIPLAGGKELREIQWSAERQSETAKGEIDALKERLRERGEISKVHTTQVRAVNAQKAGK